MINEKLLLKELMESGIDDSEDGWLLGFIIGIIDRLPKIKQCERDCKTCWKFELLKTKWIPCSEELPKKDGKYLVVIDGAKSASTLYFLHSIKAWIDGFGNHYNVTKWMPLPDPCIKKPKVAIVGDGRWKEAMMKRFEKVE